MTKTKAKKTNQPPTAIRTLSTDERSRLRGRVAVLCCSDRWAIDVYSAALDEIVGASMKELRRWSMTFVYPPGRESVGIYPPGGRHTTMIQVERTWYPAYYTWQRRGVFEQDENGKDVPAFITEDDRLLDSYISEQAMRKERKHYLNVIALLLGFPIDESEHEHEQRITAEQAEMYGYSETPIELPRGGSGNDDPLAAQMWMEMRDLGLVLAALREDESRAHLTLREVREMTRDIRYMARIVQRGGREKRFGRSFVHR